LEQSRSFGGCVLKRGKNLASLSEIEGSLALDHGGSDFGLVAIVLHERLTGTTSRPMSREREGVVQAFGEGFNDAGKFADADHTAIRGM
jgi:hypothetical protein